MQNRDMQVRYIMATTCSFKDLFSLCVCVCGRGGSISMGACGVWKRTLELLELKL